MRRLVQLVLALVAVVTLTPVTSASAQTCSNISCVATSLKSNPVYQDPAAEVKLSSAQQQELRDKIGTREPRVFIALLPLKAADANGGVNEVPGRIGQALGIPSSVGVIAGTNFRARSGGGAPFATNQISKLATDAFERNNPGKNGGNVMPMLLSFIDAVRSAPQVQPTTQATTNRSQTPFQPAKKKSNTGRNILIFLLILLVIGALIAAYVVWLGHKRIQARKEDLKSKISNFGTSLYTLENGGDTFNTIAKAHLRKANNYYANAQSDLESNDLDGAESYLEAGRKEFAKADAMANEPEPAPEPPPAPTIIPVDTAKRVKKGQPKIREAQIDPEGHIVINNTVQVPRQQQEPGYTHYFPGGYYGGRYIYGGYYPMSFWDYMVIDAMMDDRRDSHGHHHENGSQDDREAATVGGGSWDGTTNESNTLPEDYENGSPGGNWSGNSEESTGGGSWEAPEPEPSYSPPAYDPPSYDPPSYDPPSGGDWGGGGGGDTGGGSW